MPQPVQPPEIPAIIQPSIAEDAASLDKSANGTSVSASTQTLQAGVLATPTPPETFAPESSPLTVAKSAALLGPPISVGHSLTSGEIEVTTEEQREDSPTQLQSEKLPILQQAGQVRGEVQQPEDKQPILQQAGQVRGEVQQTEDSQSQQRESLPSTSPASPPPVVQNPPPLPTPASPDFLPSNSSSVTSQAPKVKRLLTQERGGQTREFELNVPTQPTQSVPDEKLTPPPNQGGTPPQPAGSQGSQTTTPTTPFGVGGVIELTGDRQEYDDRQKVITAVGNVVLRFREAILNADRVQVNLPNRIVVAEGNVALTRGQQVLRGKRFEYYFVQDSGVIMNATGELYTPTSGTDLDIAASPQGNAGNGAQPPLSDRITNNQPLQGVTSAGGYSFVVGAGATAENVSAPLSGGTINRLRYEADRVDFDGKGAIATNVRITNDPFSPPELELRADTARFTRVEPLVDEIVTSRSRLVFDQGLEVPTFRNRITIDRRPREPGLFNIGYDGGDRGGLFVERPFQILNTPGVRLSVTPQYFIQKAISEGSIIDPSVFGVRGRLDATLGPRTTVTGRAVLTTLDPTDLEDKTRASLQLQQIIGTTRPYTLNVRYSYRDRLFNGSLGFQTVQSSFGAVLSSPNIPLSNTGINLNYQVGAQYINADTDRVDLLEPVRTNDRTNLGRFEGSATLSKGFVLWQGRGLPATPTEGLRYTPAPVVPYVALGTSLTGVASAYTSGDSQQSLSGTIGLSGQFGHFSRPFLDYTGFNLSYTQVVRNGLSPFLFDRIADTSVLSAGITQQIYGPFRFGIQTAINLNTGQEISTDYLLEYSRRAYNIQLRYNPVQQLGSISFRISDFNWTGNPGVFDRSEVRPVIQGVPQRVETGD